MDEFVIEEWFSEGNNAAVVKQERPALSQLEVKILNYVEQTFWETGLLPTSESCSESLGIGIQFVRRAFQSEVLRQQLAVRGIDPVGLVIPGKLVSNTKALSAKQILVANMMLNLHDKRSEREKLALCQVSSQQYHAWLRNPSFVEFMRKRGEALFQSSDFQAYKSLVNNVKAGDNKSLELFFRMRGIYNPSIDINVNVESVLIQVVEVISRHVKDPTIINAIANELDSIIDAEEVA